MNAEALWGRQWTKAVILVAVALACDEKLWAGALQTGVSFRPGLGGDAIDQQTGAEDCQENR